MTPKKLLIIICALLVLVLVLNQFRQPAFSVSSPESSLRSLILVVESGDFATFSTRLAVITPIDLQLSDSERSAAMKAGFNKAVQDIKHIKNIDDSAPIEVNKKIVGFKGSDEAASSSCYFYKVGNEWKFMIMARDASKLVPENFNPEAR